MTALRTFVDRSKLAIALRFKPQFRVDYFARQNSLCQHTRLIGLRQLADRIASENTTGDIVECGVYRGGSAVVIGDRLLRRSKRTMWLFDVFTGMPKPGPEDPTEAWDDVGKFVSSPQCVAETFRQAQVPLDSVRIIPGTFATTLPQFETRSVAFLHIDCDWYESVKICLEKFYEMVVSGGVIVFDDYGFWSGCRKAVDEFISRRGINVRLTPVDAESHYFIKP